jgi:pimeloyl-ACP methyl ester carboxylesterase
LALVIGVAGASRAQDLGKLFEKAARDELRQVLTPPPGGRPSAGRLGHEAGASAGSPEPHVIKTRDGWTLVALRYRPAGQPPAGAMPVILCHGLTYNALFWDLDPSCSLPRYLAARGFDVWAVNLRGCGMSQKWIWNVEQAPEAVVESALRRLSKGKIGATSYASADPKYANWTLDDHILHDVPALVHFVRRATGAQEVAWVGHSMGGIVAICHLARYNNPGIGRLVTVGSQVTMPKGQLMREYLSGMMAMREKQLTGQPTVQDLADLSKTGVHNMFFNVDNVLPKVYQALSGPATDVPAIGLMMQYRTLSERGVLFDAKGQFNYARAVPNITVPIFLSCGASDQFAPPPVQEYLYRHVGSTDKTLMIFGRGQGMSVDAGHDDALVGLNSRDQVYPVIARWLSAPPRTAAAQP